MKQRHIKSSAQDAKESSPIIDLEKVVSVYSGKVNRCACGCSGKHRYASKFWDYANDIGDPIWREDVSDRTVKLIVNKMNKMKPIFYGNHFYVETPTRLYIAYLATK